MRQRQNPREKKCKNNFIFEDSSIRKTNLFTFNIHFREDSKALAWYSIRMLGIKKIIDIEKLIN